ncbi:MAG: GAF domain-containing protein [Anaerolineae bacterium]|nr:GAF domain-containing protein [Anaerolineae bacterium]
MADLLSLLVTSSCLGLFVLVSLPDAQSARLFSTGFRGLSLLITYFALGPIPAAAIAVLGAGVVIIRQPPENRAIALRHLLPSGLLALTTVILSAWWWAAGPLDRLTPESAAPVALAILVGYGVGHLAEAGLTGSFILAPREWFAAIAQMVIVLVVPSAAAQVGAGLLLVIGLLALVVWSLQEADRARRMLKRQFSPINRSASDSPLDLDALLWSVYTHLSSSVDKTGFCFALYDEARQRLDFRLVVMNGQKVEPPPPLVGEAAAFFIAQHRLALHLSVHAGQSPPAWMPSWTFRDYLGVSLRVGAEVAGVLSVMHATRADAFGDDALRLLEDAAQQTGLAVHHVVLTTRYQHMVQKITLINESAQQVMFDGDRLSGLEAACHAACAISGADKSAIFLNVGPEVDLQMGVGLPDRYRDWIMVNQPALHEDVLMVPDTRAHRNPVLYEASQLGAFQALIELPLRSGRVIQGLLAVYFDVPHAFGPEDIHLLTTLAGQIAALLENTRLVDVMEQYVYEIGQLVQLSRISTSSLNLTAVVHDIADMLQQMTNASRVAIVALEAERVRLLAAANGTTATATDRLEPFPELIDMGRDPNPVPRVLQAEDAGLSPGMAAYMAVYGEQAIILVPMIVDSVVMGVIVLGSQEPRRFEARESQFVEMAANQVATQINNIWLHEKIQQELDRRLAQVVVVEDIAQQVSSSLDFNQIINHVLEAAIRATDADLVFLALITETDQLWVIEQRIEKGQSQWRYFSRSRETGLPGYVLSQGRPVVVANNQQTDFYESDYGSAYQSSLGVPLLKDADILGLLAVESKLIGAFSQEQAGFMTSLAGHAVMSIENARFLEERRNEIDLLKNLRDLSLWLVSADDIRSVGFEILETALQLLQGKQAVLYANEADGLRPLTKLWYTEGSNLSAEERLPDALAQEAARTGELAHLVDVREHPAFSGDFDYDSAVAIPLKRAQLAAYILVVTFDGHRQLIDRDQNTIELLAGQAIGHLENASLHERIREGRDQMRTILNSTRDGLILLDCDVRLIESNPAAHRLLGVDLSEQEDAYFPDLLLKSNSMAGEIGYTADDLDELVTILHTQPEAETRRELRRRSDGQILYLEELGLPVMGDGDEITGRLLVLRDVTEAHLLEEQREDLTDMVVHDFRGPLGAIQNAVDLVLPRLGEPEDQEDNQLLLNAARDNAAHLMRLAEILLEISRMERPGLELKREALPLEALVLTGLTAVRTTAQRAHIALKADLPADLPLIYVDPEKIERVMINLLDNAVRYTPPGGSILVTASVLEPERWMEVCVADSGPGIPRERRQDVFERFRRIPGQEPHRGQKGHGLGLNFVKLAVERHGGTIRIAEDCSLSGACFVLTLPIVES